MIHTLRHNLISWKVWAGGLVLIGLLLIATQCSPGPKQTATPLAKNPPPEITGFTLTSSGPVLPGAQIGIQVNVKLNSNKIDNYRWIVGAGEGSIVSGKGTSLITYEVPKIPGTYEVRVELEYEGGPPVEGSTIVKVVPEPTPLSTEEPTAEPTEEPSEEPTVEPTPARTPTILPSDTLTPTHTSTLPTDMPTPTHTPTNTPTPTRTPTDTPTPTHTPIPAPVLITPEDGANPGTTNPTFSWRWDGQLQKNEYFDLRMWRKDENHCQGVMSVRDTPRQPNANGEYVANPSIVNVGDKERLPGTHYWSVAVMREVDGNIVAEVGPRTTPGAPGQLVGRCRDAIMVDVSPEATPHKLIYISGDGDNDDGDDDNGDGRDREPPPPQP